MFERPRLDELSSRYAVVDMHFHSHLSDGHDSIEAIAERAVELGIGIAVTDHNAIHGAVEIDRFPTVFSIPGIELTSYEGTHVLVYFYEIKSLLRFYSRDVQPHMGAEVMSSLALELEEIIRRARRFETVVVFPHPYSGSYTGLHNPYFRGERFAELLELADGIEVINSENLNKWNLRSALLGFNLNKGITGGSDGHRLSQMGRVVTVADCAVAAAQLPRRGQAAQDPRDRQGDRPHPQDDLQRRQAALQHQPLPRPGAEEPALPEHHLACDHRKRETQLERAAAPPPRCNPRPRLTVVEPRAPACYGWPIPKGSAPCPNT
ncbi:MAG: PHP domain-containing protein [Rhodopseudomonas palustris]|nr:PHP domain-containing protein [Rhodopseudomonas palustris]